MAMTTDLAGETRSVNKREMEKRQRDGIAEQRQINQKKNYLKEATVTVDTSNGNVRAEDVIKVVTETIGKGEILAVRPKLNQEYEVTLENLNDVELLED